MLKTSIIQVGSKDFVQTAHVSASSHEEQELGVGNAIITCNGIVAVMLRKG